MHVSMYVGVVVRNNNELGSTITKRKHLGSREHFMVPTSMKNRPNELVQTGIEIIDVGCHAYMKAMCIQHLVLMGFFSYKYTM